MEYKKGFDSEIAEYLLKGQRYLSYQLCLSINSVKQLQAFIKFVNSLTEEQAAGIEFKEIIINLSYYLGNGEDVDLVYEAFQSKGIDYRGIQLNTSHLIYTKNNSYKYSRQVL